MAALGGLGKLPLTVIDPGMLNLFNAVLAVTTTAEANQVGAQLRAEPHASGTQAAMTPTMEVLNVVAAHADNLRLAKAYGETGIATGEAQRSVAMWGEVFGGVAKQGRHDNTDGFHVNSGGLLIGGDGALSDNFRAGAIVSAARTNVADAGDRSGSSTHLASYGVIAYASYTGEPWYVDVSAGAIQHQYDTVRVINFTGFSGVANGQHNGMQKIIKVEGGYPLAVGATESNTTLTPLVGLTYSYLHQDGFTETGGNGAALNVAASVSPSLKSEIGLKLERGFATNHGDLVPEVRIMWRHEYRNEAQLSSASFAADLSGATGFSTMGPRPMVDSAVISAGLTLVHSKDVTLSAKYDVELANAYVAQTARLRLRWQF